MSDRYFHRNSVGPAHDALNRMRRAYLRGTGCSLTSDMIEALGRTVIGQMWEDEDPRRAEEAI